MNAQEQILAAYADAGFKMVRLSRRDKSAVDKNWQSPENVPTLADITTWVARGENVGIQCGPQSGGLAVAECDSEYARRLSREFLPETLTAAKEGEDLPAHFFYIAEGAPYRKVRDLEGEILSLKSTDKGKGHYVVVEPSVHPTKGAYVFQGGFDAGAIARVSSEELEMHVNSLGAAALIAEHLPGGGRHEYGLALAGFMLRNDETTENVLHILRGAWFVNGAPSKAMQDLEDIVEDTRERLSNGEPVSGGKTLNELVDRRFATRLSRALGWERADEGEGREVRDLTDIGNAERLVAKYGERIRYIPEWHSWVVYDGKRWQRDPASTLVLDLAMETVREIFREAGYTNDDELQASIFTWAQRSAMMPRLEAMVKAARGKAAAKYEDFDSDPWLFNCPNGTVDLRTGELREHRAEDLIMKMSGISYDRTAVAPRFEKFLERVLPNTAVRGFVQRLTGYALTGTTDEQVLPFFYGTGANGKSTYLNIVLHAVGDYGQQAGQSVLMAKSYDSHPTELADLFRARLVVTTELDNGRQLAEATVKQLTGGDRIRARRMREDLWEFVPTHTMIVAANHKPEITGTDKGIWRRIKVVPWDVVIPEAERNPQLPRILENELGGILAWLVRGCQQWRSLGLKPPPEVEAETEEYRAEQDVLAGFIADKCVTGDVTGSADSLYIAYKEWCVRSGEQQESQKGFGSKLRERGFDSKRMTSGPNKGRIAWVGIAVRHDGDDPDHSPGEPSFTTENPIDKPESTDIESGVNDSEANSGSHLESPTRNTGLTGNTVHYGSPFTGYEEMIGE